MASLTRAAVRIDGATLDRFAALVGELLGCRVDLADHPTLDALLRARVTATGCGGPTEYLARIAPPAVAGRDEVRALAEALTVNESYFFRLPEQLRAFSEEVLPDRLRRRASNLEPRLGILSAGSSNGEEAYTAAILVDDARTALHRGWQFDITGIDVHAPAIARARRARYGPWSLRGTPADVVDRCFRRSGRELEVDERIRALVTFEERNLVDDDPAFWSPGRFDVIFCRHVAIYLSVEVFHRLLERFHRTLAPGGYLFLGPAETARELPALFNVREAHGAFFYQRREVPEPARSAPRSIGTERARAPRVAASSVGTTTVSASRATTPTASVTPVATVTPDRYEIALELFRQERFVDARRLLESTVTDDEALPTRVLHAAVLANLGDFAAAEALAARADARCAPDAAAQLLLGICREQAGDVAGALRHHRAARFLDARCALAYLHGGRLARRSGDRVEALRSLRLAQRLLPDEEPLRLLLFGGGFGREALAELCASELRACDP